MDNTAQNNANDDAQAKVQPQPQPQAPVSQAPTIQPQPQPAPVGSMNKEAELAPVSDFVKPAETPAVKDKEVAEAGVTEVTQSVELSKEHKEIGIEPAAEATPVKIPSQQSEENKLPMTQLQAAQVIKKGPGMTNLGKHFEGIYFVDSIYALAVLMVKHFKKMHRNIFKKGNS
jgi:hypothetical protein